MGQGFVIADPLKILGAIPHVGGEKTDHIGRIECAVFGTKILPAISFVHLERYLLPLAVFQDIHVKLIDRHAKKARQLLAHHNHRIIRPYQSKGRCVDQ